MQQSSRAEAAAKSRSGHGCASFFSLDRGRILTIVVVYSTIMLLYRPTISVSTQLLGTIDGETFNAAAALFARVEYGLILGIGNWSSHECILPQKKE